MPKCDIMNTRLLVTNEKNLGTTKYELSLCHKCKLIHTNVEDCICNLCA